MREVSWRSSVLAMVLLLVLPAAGAGASPAGGDGEPTRLLVTYAAPVDGEVEAAAFSTASLQAVAPDAPDATSAVQVLSFDDPADAARAARHLDARPDVLAVEEDRLLTIQRRDLEVVPLSAADAVVAPTASWGVDNDGSIIRGVTGQRGIDVGAAKVAHRATGLGVVVAVIDSGVDVDHPLLRDRMWRNPREVQNGIDSDANGYVDDIHGWDFVNDRPQVFNPAGGDEHGTHVAAIIAGTAHAPSGYRSVAPDARIMALKFIEGEAGYTSGAIAAVRYAIANGAHVINASWGGPEASLALRTVMAESPIPIVVAAGNQGATLETKPSYPASFGLPNVISVAALDNLGAMPSFSSRSRNLVDVAAPGTDILSAYPNSQLAWASGTSAAAPHVAGVLALALQRHPRQDPIALAELVRATVRPLAGANQTRSGGIVRAPGLLDALGTRMPTCAQPSPVAFTDVPSTNVHRPAVGCLVATGVTRGITPTRFGASEGLTRAQIATLVAKALERTGALPAPPVVGRFTDVSATNVHRDSIETLAALGIVRGVSSSSYAPTRTVTRAELAAVTARAAEYLAGAEIRARGPHFTDTVGIPEAREIDKAAGLRIVQGRGGGLFEPAAPVRRDQAASMVGQLLDRLVQQGLLDPV